MFIKISIIKTIKTFAQKKNISKKILFVNHHIFFYIYFIFSFKSMRDANYLTMLQTAYIRQKTNVFVHLKFYNNLKMDALLH